MEYAMFIALFIVFGAIYFYFGERCHGQDDGVEPEVACPECDDFDCSWDCGGHGPNASDYIRKAMRELTR